MQSLIDRINNEGTVLPGNVLKVGSFLNQQIDAEFMMQIGKEIADTYVNDNITKVLTIESSGIAIAFAVAYVLHVPVVFAKKSKSSNQSEDVYSEKISSYTHGNTYLATVGREFLGKNDRILIVDDFLACGNAFRGLISIVKQSGAEMIGCASVIEKGFQHGGDALRSDGFRVESLAIIDSMDTQTGIIYR